MTATGQTCAVVDLADGRFGVLTDRDLRTRVVAAGLPVDTAVARAMSAPAYTVTEDRLAGDVLVEMLDRGVRHFPVLSKTGALLGVVDDADLIAAERRTPFHLRTAIGRAADAAELAVVSRDLWPTVAALHDARVAPEHVGAIVSVVTDALVRRLLDLAVADAGEPPSPFAWLALGSVARREAVPSSDIDSAIAWDGDDDDAATRAYVERVAQRVLDGLEACGLHADPKGATAAHRLFARSLDAWGAAIDGWFDDPTQEKALILVSIVGDSRPVWGVHRAAPLAEHVAAARSHRGLLRLMARYALLYRPPTGFLRDLVVEHSGEHKGRLDLKHGGMLPIVDLARWAGMAAGATSSSTRERLRAARDGGVLSDDDGRVLEEAFALVCALRLEHQVEQVREGRRPTTSSTRAAHAADAQLPQGRLPRRGRGAAADRGGAALRHRLSRRGRGRRAPPAARGRAPAGRSRLARPRPPRRAGRSARPRPAGRSARRRRPAARRPGSRSCSTRTSAGCAGRGSAARARSRPCAVAPASGSSPRAGGRCPRRP